jgi:vacuolar protein sorting-associated protein 13A/C
MVFRYYYNIKKAVAEGALQGVTSQSKAGLLFAIEEHKTLDLSVEADAPIFIIPLKYLFLNQEETL